MVTGGECSGLSCVPPKRYEAGPARSAARCDLPRVEVHGHVLNEAEVRPDGVGPKSSMTSVLRRQPGDNGVTGRDVTMKAKTEATQLRAKEPGILAASHPELGAARKDALTGGGTGLGASRARWQGEGEQRHGFL